MGWTDPATIITLLAASILVASAVVVLRRGARREINLRLFWVMVYEGLFLFVLAVNLGGRWPYADSSIALWLDVISRFTVAVLLAVQSFYLRFLATLRSPLAAPLRTWWGWLVLGPLIVANMSVPLLMALPWSPPAELFATIRWVFIVNFMPLVTVFALALYGLAIVVDAYRRVPRESPRRRGVRSLVWAFGLRNALWVSLLALILASMPTTESAAPAPQDGQVVPPEPSTFDVLFTWVVDLAPALISLVFIGFLAYGVLVNQMFDIDLRVKNWTRRGLWAGLAAVTFFVAAESLETVLSLGGLVPGVLAAGIAALALAPLRRVAVAVVERVFPGVLDSTRYQAKRKADVYRALAEELAADGDLSDADRSTLRALLERLGLSEQDVARIEERHLHQDGHSGGTGGRAAPPG